MKQKLLFPTLLCSTRAASGAKDSMDRYFVSMFGSFYAQQSKQPMPSTVNDMKQGKRPISRKLMQFYRDPENPRCPQKLKFDLTALADCVFCEAAQHRALRIALEEFLMEIPDADAEDLCQILASDDLMQEWTMLVWYAMCHDRNCAA